MFVKVIGSLILLAFCFVQLGSSLDCYSCSTPTACKTPTTVTCNWDRANATTAHLHYYFNGNHTNAASNNFDCFHHNYTSSVSTIGNVTYKGCIYRAIEPCSLSLKTEFNQLKKESCYTCSGNYCNPAGTFSSSTITVFASILAVCLYKVLSM